jgi:hypothetical protein
MKVRVLFFAVLVGIALTLVAPAAPSSARLTCPPQAEPTEDCPAAPPAPRPMMQPTEPGAPAPSPNPQPTPAPIPSSICNQNLGGAETVIANDTGRTAYKFEVDITFCTDRNSGLITSAVFGTSTPRPQDARVTITQAPDGNGLQLVSPGAAQSGVEFISTLNVKITAGSVTQTYEHRLGLRLLANPTRLIILPVEGGFRRLT